MVDVLEEMMFGKKKFPQGGGKEEPWYVRGSIKFLEVMLKKNMVGFEWGGGTSSIWIAKRIKSLVTVESVPNWIKRIKQAAKHFNLTNIETKRIKNDCQNYPNSINKYPNLHFDCIFVDGHQRVKCLKNAKNKLKSKGFLIVDNSNWKELRGVKKQFKNWKKWSWKVDCEFDWEGKHYTEWETTIWQKN